jgi:lipopolysaccharide/colanic/teichoic acid biosynthesis glycosyltransferase
MLLIIALAIKLESSGPIFFRQIRIGLRGKKFEYLKFRTMCVEAFEIPTGPVFNIASDPRITRVGHFLRITALDELPTLFSVLLGDMSVIGPRPAIPFEVEYYSEEQLRRLELKPGITGYWQVFGREEGILDLKKMIEMDLEYAENRSFALDFRILLGTIFMALQRRSAY